jgi:hypothetical protein
VEEEVNILEYLEYQVEVKVVKDLDQVLKIFHLQFQLNL